MQAKPNTNMTNQAQTNKHTQNKQEQPHRNKKSHNNNTDTHSDIKKPLTKQKQAQAATNK